MKKIVALVLALALALSLCTVAMAVAPTAAGEAALVKTVASATSWNDTWADDYTIEVKAYGAAPYTTTAAGQFLQEYKVVVTDKETKAQEQLANSYVLAANETSADLVVVNGSSITYLALNTHNDGYKADEVVTAVATVKNTATLKCGDVVTETGKTLYKDAAGAYYVAGDTTYKLLGDKVIHVDLITVTTTTSKTTAADADNDAPAKLAHFYKADRTVVNGEETITKVYCDTCKATFDFVVGGVADAVTKFGSGNFEKAGTIPANADGDFVFVKTASATTSTSTTTVDSSKTFDAGVAMYVGLSLMSVAGSAVVIGKKKEF